MEQGSEEACFESWIVELKCCITADVKLRKREIERKDVHKHIELECNTIS